MRKECSQSLLASQNIIRSECERVLVRTACWLLELFKDDGFKLNIKSDQLLIESNCLVGHLYAQEKKENSTLNYKYTH